MMIQLMRRLMIVAVLAVAGLSVLPAPAYALSIEQAKVQGLVGEKLDGLLGAVAPSAAVNALVQDVNSRRMKLFNEIAASKGQSLATVQAISGQEFIARTAPGHFIQTPAGGWTKK